MARIDALAAISEEENRLTRTFCTPAMRKACAKVEDWMREAGMNVRFDAIGNIIGRYEGAEPNRKTLLMGSHLDTVCDAGKFDGPLGVLLAIESVHALSEKKVRLPFGIEVIGFADEEGVRYQSTYLGSKAVAGNFNLDDLQRKDANGTSMAEAIRSYGGDADNLRSARREASDLLGYFEAHIEQGPVLEARNIAVGVVTAISGQTRAEVRFSGRSGHAGTVPMDLRSDALCAGAEFILSVEQHAQQCPGLVATVGKVAALPGATNVIPGEVVMSLDLRHALDETRVRAVGELSESAKQVAARRHGISSDFKIIHQASSTACDADLSRMLADSISKHQRGDVPRLPSGAGHDAAAISILTPVAMLFIRCKGGISHHPDESVKVEDVAVAHTVMMEFLNELLPMSS